MNRIFFMLIVAMAYLGSQSQIYRQFIEQIDSLPSQEREEIIEPFILAHPESPWFESDTAIIFLYSGEAHHVSMAGDANKWNPQADILNHVDGTDFWYLKKIYPADARLDYKLVINDTIWITDPRNPATIGSGYGVNSELTMPGYVRSPEIFYDSTIAHGSVYDTNFWSDDLKNSRSVIVYTPVPVYKPDGEKYPVILFHDGKDFISLGCALKVLDYLIAKKMIKPVIAVFIPPVNRDEEYHGKKKENYTDFIVENIYPWLEKRFAVSTNCEDRAVAGISDGGNISLWMAVSRPDFFGKVAAFSSNIIPEIEKRFEKDSLPLKIYLDIGRYDIDFLKPMGFKLRKILNEKGYDHLFNEWNEGHSWGSWRAHLDIALIYFFGKDQ